MSDAHPDEETKIKKKHSMYGNFRPNTQINVAIQLPRVRSEGPATKFRALSIFRGPDLSVSPDPAASTTRDPTGAVIIARSRH